MVEPKREAAHPAPNLGGLQAAVLQHATVAGVLTSRPTAKDIRLEQVSITLGREPLLQDTALEVVPGARYGLVGRNGGGKSTLLAALATRQLPIPSHIDVWYLREEVAPSQTSAMQCVTQVGHWQQETLRAELEGLREAGQRDSAAAAAMQSRLDGLDPATFEQRAGRLLHHLGFHGDMMHRPTKDLSGGWRMRVALAQALFANPSLLLLDEPTNHLDLDACVWLEATLRRLDGTLIVVSHSQDLLNAVCTKIMHLTVQGTLEVWGGDYATFVKAKEERDRNLWAKYHKEQDDIAQLKKFIASAGTFANLQKQAQSKQKVIDKMVEAGLTKPPQEDPAYEFFFPDPGKLPTPVIGVDGVSFAYPGGAPDLFRDLHFGVDLDSRIALVGPNGAGKSTLLKLLCGELEPTAGAVQSHRHLRIGRYCQHSREQLPLNASPLAFMQQTFPELYSVDEWRKTLGMFGVSGDRQTRPMRDMSNGLQTRVVLMAVALRRPHVLLLDEPTNHMDMQSVDALAQAINEFSGGLLLVSHDFHLIGQVAKELWICDHKSVTRWDGDIRSYKKHLQSQHSRSGGGLGAELTAGQSPAQVPQAGPPKAKAKAAPKEPSIITNAVKKGWGTSGSAKATSKHLSTEEFPALNAAPADGGGASSKGKGKSKGKPGQKSADAPKEPKAKARTVSSAAQHPEQPPAVAHFEASKGAHKTSGSRGGDPSDPASKHGTMAQRSSARGRKGARPPSANEPPPADQPRAAALAVPWYLQQEAVLLVFCAVACIAAYLLVMV